MSDHKQQPAPSRGTVLEALVQAERRVYTRPVPESAKAQVKFLLTRAKGPAKALAERLGFSRRTVERYRAGKLTTPQKRLMEHAGVAVRAVKRASQWARRASWARRHTAVERLTAGKGAGAPLRGILW